MNIRKLKEYEEQGYLFHGSPSKIEILKPMQAYSCNNKLDKMVVHGNPCVAATPFLDIAIFRALINRQNAPENHDSSFGYSSDKGLNFEASQKTFDQIKNKRGYVYILDKKYFEKFSGMEWRAEKEVKPIDMIEVSFGDLPEDINLII